MRIKKQQQKKNYESFMNFYGKYGLLIRFQIAGMDFTI